MSTKMIVFSLRYIYSSTLKQTNKSMLSSKGKALDLCLEKLERNKKLLRGNGICTGLKDDKISKCGYREDLKMNPGQPNKGTEQRCKYK